MERVARQDPDIAEAQKAGDVSVLLKVSSLSLSSLPRVVIYIVLEDEDFPRAFDGKTREEIASLKPWTKKRLFVKAKLF